DEKLEDFTNAANVLLWKRGIPDLGQVVVSNSAKAYSLPAEPDNVYRYFESPANVVEKTRATVFSPVHYTSFDNWLAVGAELTGQIATAFDVKPQDIEVFTIEKSHAPRFIGGKWQHQHVL
ncbi:MAG: hypothetical protein PHE27_01360, partial [Alphaproteobacteria bacterium]|nr:hypothetical protein [Alphaproteobacteria bacterium]